MKIFGVNIKYDKNETLKCQREHENKIPMKKLRRLRAYEVTNEFDAFRKWRLSFSLLDTLRVHALTVFAYWIYRIKLRFQQG